MMESSAWIYFLLFLVLPSDNKVYGCNEEGMVACNNVFIQELGVNLTTLDLTVHMNRDYLTRVCSGYATLLECIGPHKDATCADDFMNHLDGEEALFNFICHEGFEDHLKYTPCLSKTSTATTRVLCKLKLHFDQILAPSQTTEQQRCGWVEDFIDCNYNVGLNYCDRDAAAHLLKLTQLYNQPAFEEKCSHIVWGKTTTTSTTTDTTSTITTTADNPGEPQPNIEDTPVSTYVLYGCIPLILILIVAIVIIAVVCYKRKHSSDQNGLAGQMAFHAADHNTMEQGAGAERAPPPPYSVYGDPPVYEAVEDKKDGLSRAMGHDYSTGSPHGYDNHTYDSPREHGTNQAYDNMTYETYEVPVTDTVTNENGVYQNIKY